MNESRVEDRSILITGAGSGIGRGIAEMSARDGWDVWLTDRNSEAVNSIAETLRAAGLSARAAYLDVTDQNAVDAFLHSLGANSIDVLINNAGQQHVAAFEEFPHEKWEHLIDIMLNGVARVTRAVLPKMPGAPSGRIINIGSIHSLVASPYKSAYVAAKHGLLGLSKALALETADRGITVNTICPSYVRTSLVDQQIESQAEAHGISPEQVVEEIMLAPMPLRSFISIEEIYETVVFLASDAARSITGQTIVIDGGWTIR